MKKTDTRTHHDDWTDRARAMMDLQGLTYDDISAVLGVATRGSVSHYFRQRRDLSAQQAVALAERLDCGLEWLLTGRRASDHLRSSAASALPDPDELCALLRKLRPTSYAVVAQLILELLPHRMPGCGKKAGHRRD